MALASPSLYQHIQSITHMHHPFQATDHATLHMVLDFDKAESGPGIIRCQPSLHANKDYQTMGRDKVRLTLYECMVSQDMKCDIEKTIIYKRQALSQNIIQLRKDPNKVNDLNNHELQLALYLSCEPTIEELLERPMSIGKATLHEFILMKLKEATLEFSKALKVSTRKEVIRKENELNELVNSETINSFERIQLLEGEILQH